MHIRPVKAVLESLPKIEKMPRKYSRRSKGARTRRSRKQRGGGVFEFLVSYQGTASAGQAKIDVVKSKLSPQATSIVEGPLPVWAPFPPQGNVSFKWTVTSTANALTPIQISNAATDSSIPASQRITLTSIAPFLGTTVFNVTYPSPGSPMTSAQKTALEAALSSSGYAGSGTTVTESTPIPSIPTNKTWTINKALVPVGLLNSALGTINQSTRPAIVGTPTLAPAPAAATGPAPAAATGPAPAPATAPAAATGPTPAPTPAPATVAATGPAPAPASSTNTIDIYVSARQTSDNSVFNPQSIYVKNNTNIANISTIPSNIVGNGDAVGIQFLHPPGGKKITKVEFATILLDPTSQPPSTLSFSPVESATISDKDLLQDYVYQASTANNTPASNLTLSNVTSLSLYTSSTNKIWAAPNPSFPRPPGYTGNLMHNLKITLTFSNP